MRFLCLLLFACSLLINNTFAQSLSSFVYTTEHGLPGESLKDVSQDRLGFVWLSTDEGLVRFDGINAQMYKNGLPSHYTKRFLRRHDDQLLVATDLGIVEIISRPDTAYFKPIIAGGVNLTDTALWYPKKLYEDRRNNLWIMEPLDVCRYTNGKFKRYHMDRKNHSFDFFYTWSMAEDHRGNLLAFSLPGYAYIYDPQTDQFNELKLPEKFSFVNGVVRRDSSMVICSNLGIFEFRLDAKRQVTGWKKLYTGSVFAVEANRAGDLFFAHVAPRRGIYRMKKGTQQAELVGLSHLQFINYLYMGQQDKLWIASEQGLGLVQPTFFSSVPEFLNQRITGVGQEPGGSITAITSSLHLLKPARDGIHVRSLVSERSVLQTAFTSKLAVISTSHGRVDIYDRKQLLAAERIDTTRRIFQYLPPEPVFFMHTDRQENIWAIQLNHELLIRIMPDGKTKNYSTGQGIKSPLLVCRSDARGNMYAGGWDKNCLYRYDREHDVFISLPLSLPFKVESRFGINDIGFDRAGGLWLGTTHGLLHYSNQKVTRVDLGMYTQENIKSVVTDAQGTVWLAVAFGVMSYTGEVATLYNESDGLPSKSTLYHCLFMDRNNWLWVGTYTGIAYVSGAAKLEPSNSPLLLGVKKIYNRQVEKTREQAFRYGTMLDLQFVSLAFPGRNTVYQTRIIGMDEHWSAPSPEGRLVIPLLSVGSYTIEIRAKQQGNHTWSEPLGFSFSILPAWYQTWWAFLLYAVVLIVVVVTATRIYTWRLFRQKEQLEKLVSERSAEILFKNQELEQQKEEITVQAENLKQANEEITAHRDALAEQTHEIARKNEDITASINYARRIQEAMLPQMAEIQSVLSDSFVLFRPRDIVSGDFYWFSHKKNGHATTKAIIAAADCTGHGVPGALMSMIGSSLLSEIVNEKGITEADRILNQLHIRLRQSLRQMPGEHTTTARHDGLDIALCVIDFGLNTIEYAGAKNPLILIREENGTTQLQEIKADRVAIGGQQCEDERVFTRHQFDISKPTTFYIFSDGFQDQFGGKQNRKFMARQLREVLFNIHHKPMQEQKQVLEQTLEDWMAASEPLIGEVQSQIDDVLVVGVRIAPSRS